MNIRKIIKEEIDDFKWIKDSRMGGSPREWTLTDMRQFMKPDTKITISGEMCESMQCDISITLKDHPFKFEHWSNRFGDVRELGQYMSVRNENVTNEWVEADLPHTVVLGIYPSDDELFISLV